MSAEWYAWVLFLVAPLGVLMAIACCVRPLGVDPGSPRPDKAPAPIEDPPRRPGRPEPPVEDPRPTGPDRQARRARRRAAAVAECEPVRWTR